MNSIELRVARADELDRVREILRTIYYPEEGITISYVHGKEPTLDDERFSLSFVQQGSVVLAEDKTSGTVVGISVAGPIEPDDPDSMIQEAATTDTKKWSDILKLLALLERTANVCGRFGLPKAYHVHILGVNPAYRGQAIGTRLMQFQVDLATKKGFGAISADFTSVYSARIADQLGMEFISQVSLDDYRDENGEKPFEPKDIHRLIKTYAKVL
ncbi:arylalkylamine N-acetyltransferase-like 2 [Topomyia yanbarensis]|uniref:arylalkylamine N-acetyltransferase-like 2 n=1 Tax=Topomyia yanbarensis TaxID=2498891 RepID=UPI00273C0912|nr:arylalkylamine N-acetyltransferase-like 2 [Topomyia yanbarensis]